MAEMGSNGTYVYKGTSVIGLCLPTECNSTDVAARIKLIAMQTLLCGVG